MTDSKWSWNHKLRAVSHVKVCRSSGSISELNNECSATVSWCCMWHRGYSGIFLILSYRKMWKRRWLGVQFVNRDHGVCERIHEKLLLFLCLPFFPEGIDVGDFESPIWNNRVDDLAASEHILNKSLKDGRAVSMSKDMGIEQEKVQNRQELRRVNVRYRGRVSFTNKCAHLLLGCATEFLTDIQKVCLH